MWSERRNLIKLMTKISDGYDEKNIKIKFNLDDELILNEIMEIFIMIIVVKAVFS